MKTINICEVKKEIFTPKPTPARKRAAPTISTDPLSNPLPTEKTPDEIIQMKHFQEKERMRAESHKNWLQKIQNNEKRKAEERKERERIEKERIRMLEENPVPKKRAKKPTPANTNVIDLKEMSQDPLIRKRQCKVCLKVFESIAKLDRHKNSHGDKIDAVCNLCNGPLKYSYNLKTHFDKCFRKTCHEKEEMLLQQNFPNYMHQLDQYAKGHLLEMPQLPEGFRIDALGMVSGYSPFIRADLSKIVPGYGVNDKAELALNSDDSDDELPASED